jgi:hypothetical protein
MIDVVSEAGTEWTPVKMPANRTEVAFEAYGVKIAVRGSQPEILERVRAYMPPGWKPCASADVERRFDIQQESDGSYSFFKDGESQTLGLNLELAVLLLDTELRLYIARKAPGVIFVHAGVVAHRGRTIVLPGVSFAGKTTLVAAMVRAGARYYSDEFAVLDENGLVHPYPKPLSLRDQYNIQIDQSVESLGGTAGDEPLPVGLVAITSYKPGGDWQPRRMSPGEGAMAVLANTVPARERPEESLRAIKQALDGAMVLESDRGEAESVARLLLAEIER